MKLTNQMTDYSKLTDEELDIEIAGKVMKLERHPDGNWLVPVYKNIVPLERIHLPKYSTSLSAAFQLVEHLRQKWFKEDPDETMFYQFVDCIEDGWRVDILRRGDAGCVLVTEAKAPTLQRAICEAALQSLESNQ
jgi:hypothetical protein